MKANYPVEFLAASMTLDMGNTDKLSEFRAEAERLGIKVEPPSVNRSGVAFEVEGNTIYYALAALKGVGRQAVESIVDGARRQAVRRSHRFRPPHQSARGQQARAGKPRRRRRVRRARAEPRAGARRRRCHDGDRAAHPRGGVGRAERHVRRRREPRDHRGARGRALARRPTGCSANTTPSASSCPAIRSTNMRRSCKS